MKSLFTIPLIIFLLLVSITIQAQVEFIEETIILPTDSTHSFPLKNLTFQSPRSLNIAIVLSGGGARGIAHLGVIKAFEEAEIPIDLIVGSSIGSAIGGFYAAGYSSEELIQVFKDIEWENLFVNESHRSNLLWSQKSSPRKHFLELRFDKGVPYIPSALTPGQKVFDMIYSRLLNANFQSANDFDNLKIPFRAVATDLLSGQRVVLEKGDLAEAISGSMAVPLLFSPVDWAGMWLVDGGITDNLPVDVALENGADLVIAVDATSPLRKKDQMNLPWHLADQVTTIMTQKPTEASQELADVLILPELNDWSSTNFSNIDSLVNQGYRAALEKLPIIRKLYDIYQESMWGENRLLGRVDEVTVTAVKSEPLQAITDEILGQRNIQLFLFDVYQNLANLYKSGYVRNAFVRVTGTPANLNLQYHIEENPWISAVQVYTNLHVADSLWNRWSNAYPRGPLNINHLFKEIDALLNHYYEAGKPLAHVLTLEYQDNSQSLVLWIDEGLISDIKIMGNLRTKDFIVSRELELKKDDLFTAEKAITSIQNIYSTQLFDRVTLNVNRTDSSNSITFRVKEKKYFLMRVGLNASVERQANSFVELAQDNLFGREVKLSLMGLIGNLEKRAEFKIYSVRLFKTLLTYRFRLYYNDRLDRYFEDNTERDDYITIRRGVHFVLGQQIARLGSITGEIRWDNVHVFSDNRDFPYGDKYRIRTITVRSVVDRRDKLPFPDRGIYNRWYWENGIKSILGGNTSFTKFYISLEGYYPVFSSLVYRISASGGVGDNTVPFSEFFSLGGMDEFPGLYQRELLGRQVFSWNNELRYRVSWNMPLELFIGMSFNLGSTWENTEDPISFSDLLTSWGSYVALNTLIGPIKLAYGHIPDVRDLIYFSIGYEF